MAHFYFAPNAIDALSVVLDQTKEPGRAITPRSEGPGFEPLFVNLPMQLLAALYDLDALVSGITADNTHGEVTFGPSVRNEAL